MGYEVLDAGRTQGADPAHGGLGPVDVVALEDLPDPHDQATGPSSPRLPRWLTRRPEHLTPQVAAALVGVAVLGLVAGGWWAARRAAADQQAGARASVSAFALVVGVDSHDSEAGKVADFSLRVYNVGALPLTVVVSDNQSRPPQGEPLVSLVTGDGTVRPGRDALVRARVPLNCESQEALRLRVPVRSPDGTVHRVDARDGDQGALAQSAQALCAQGDYVDPMPVQLTGSLSQPVLELSNTTDRPLTVSLDSGSPLTQAASEYLALTTHPALPLVVPPNASERLQVRIDVQGCHRDLGPLADGGAGYLGLRIEGVPDGMTQTGVDVSTLVGAALERSCR